MTSSRRRLVLITGSTGSIGQATAIAFARTGQYDLALHYNSASEETRAELQRTIRAAAPVPIHSNFFQADFATYDGVRRLHSAVVSAPEFARGNDDGGSSSVGVDVLFNNAGFFAGLRGVRDLADVPIDAFEATWRVNTGTAILLTQLCLPHMRARRWGRVVFNSSVAALTGGAVGPHYASSKSAMHGFIHWLGANVAPEGVTVNAVAPALVASAMIGDGESEEAMRALERKIPVGRLGRPEEVAATVLYLVDTAFVTRKIITVDGGMHPY